MSDEASGVSDPGERAIDRGRIWFVGNPWPAGHRVVDTVWTGRLSPVGLWWDLHLETAYYDDEGRPEEPEDSDDWISPGCWCNYSRCLLSSLYWRSEFPGVLAVPLDAAGSLVRRGEVLDVNHFAERVLRVDTGHDRALTFEPAFGIYLTGHDSVGDHLLTFSPSTTDAGAVDLDWRGRVALSYAGDDEFRYEFHGQLPGLVFDRIAVGQDLDDMQAAELLGKVVADPQRWQLGQAEIAPGFAPERAFVRKAERGD